MIGRLALRLIACAALAFPVLGAASPPPSASDAEWCNVAVRVTSLDRSRVALTFFTPATTASAPLIVRFASPTAIRAAVVSSLDGAGGGPCRPYFSPWFDDIAWPRNDALAASASAASTTAVNAPAPVPFTARSCTEPNALPHIARQAEAIVPRTADTHMHSAGDTEVFVVIDPAGRVVDERVVSSHGYAELDALALDVARRSVWTPGRFNCEPVACAGYFILQD